MPHPSRAGRAAHRIAFLSLAAALAAPTAAQYPTGATVQALPRPGDPGEQLAAALRTLSVNPNDLAALVAAGRNALALGDPNAAVGFFGRASTVSPRDGRAKAGLGATLVQLQRPRDALRLFGEARGLGVPDADIAAERGLAYDLSGDTAAAQRDYRLALAQRPDDETVRRRLALSQGIAGDRKGAIATLDPLIRKRDIAGWRAQTFVLAMTGDTAGANAITRIMIPQQQAALQPFLSRLASLSPADKARAVNFGEMPSAARSYSETQLAQIGTPPVYRAPAPAPAPAPPVQVAAAPTQPAVGLPIGSTGSESYYDRPHDAAARPGFRPHATAAIPRRVLPPATVAAPQPAPTVAAGTTPTTAVPITRPPVASATPPAVAPAPTGTVAASQPAPMVAAGTTPTAAVPATRPSVAVTTPSAPTTVTPAAVAPPPSSSLAQTPTPMPVTNPIVAAPAVVATAPAPTPARTDPSPAPPTIRTVPLPASETPAAPPPRIAPPPRRVVAIAPPVAPRPKPRVTAPVQTVDEDVVPQEPRKAPTKKSATSDKERTTSAKAVRDADARTASKDKPSSHGGTSKSRTAADDDAKDTPRRGKGDTVAETKGTSKSRYATDDADTAPASKHGRAAAETAHGKGGTRATDAKDDAASSDTPASRRHGKAAASDADDAPARRGGKRDADTRATREKKGKAAADASRVWVQVAGGANRDDLGKAWDGVRKKAPDLTRGKSPSSTALKATNRLLIGPFKDEDEAQAFVNKASGKGVGAFVFKSAKGQKVDKIDAPK